MSNIKVAWEAFCIVQKCWTTQSSKPDRFFATGSLSCIPASHKTWLARKSHVASRFRWFSQPFGGFLKWSYPQSSIYRWIFHHKPTSYWGTPIYGNLHIYMADHFCLFEIPSCLDFLIMYMCIYIYSYNTVYIYNYSIYIAIIYIYIGIYNYDIYI